MLHKWKCEQCGAEWSTGCGDMIMHEGKLVELYSVVYHRRQLAAMLCTPCFTEFEKNPDPVFDLMFKLREKIDQLHGLCRSLNRFYEERLVKTPEMQKAFDELKEYQRQNRLRAGIQL